MEVRRRNVNLNFLACLIASLFLMTSTIFPTDSPAMSRLSPITQKGRMWRVLRTTTAWAGSSQDEEEEEEELPLLPEVEVVESWRSESYLFTSRVWPEVCTRPEKREKFERND